MNERRERAGMSGLSEAERDVLMPDLYAAVGAIVAARLASVEALADEWERMSDGDPHDPTNAGGFAADLRAVLGSPNGHARPPSDTEATGHHRHPSVSVCEADKCHWPDVEHLGRPVLVVDPAEARETIARAIYTEGINNPRIAWLYEDEADLLAAAVIAALATETPA